MNNPFLVGITGGSASGKTRFIDQLLTQFDERDICLISQDHYYKPRKEQPIDENGVQNFDLPECINMDHFTSDIKKLKSGEAVQKEEYVYNNPDKTPKMLTFEPAPIIVIEGLFVFYIQEIHKLLDLKLFIEAKEHIKLKRRIIRDNSERGYDLDDVLYRFEKHVIPTYERFILPYRDTADIIVPNNDNFQTGLEVIVKYLKTLVRATLPK
ncbi:MAG: uridine-cytidine kinase [Bacteroidota bacterium]